MRRLRARGGWTMPEDAATPEVAWQAAFTASGKVGPGRASGCAYPAARSSVGNSRSWALSDTLRVCQSRRGRVTGQHTRSVLRPSKKKGAPPGTRTAAHKIASVQSESCAQSSESDPFKLNSESTRTRIPLKVAGKVAAGLVTPVTVP